MIPMSLQQQLHRLNVRHHPQHLYFAPEWIVLGVNNLCNMHCKMCDVGLGNTDTTFFTNLMGTDPVNMPLPLFERIVDQVAEHWPKTRLGFAFTEPLIYPDLFDALRYARGRGLECGVTTNALQLPKKAEALAQAGLDHLYVSLDGPPEIHNAIRGHAQGFQRALEGLRALAAMPQRPTLSVYCVITEWNAGHLVEFAEIFRGLPLTTLGFMHALITPQSLADTHNAQYGDRYPATASNLGEHDARRMDFDALAAEIAALRGLGLPFQVSFSPNLHTAEELRTFYLQPEIAMGKSCSDVSRTIMIKSDGSAVPAHGRCYNVSPGNVYTQTLPEIWNAPMLAQLRSDLRDAGGLLPACTRCCSAFAR